MTKAEGCRVETSRSFGTPCKAPARMSNSVFSAIERTRLCETRSTFYGY